MFEGLEIQTMTKLKIRFFFLNVTKVKTSNHGLKLDSLTQISTDISCSLKPRSGLLIS
jgi:hypothetical protein